MDSQKSSFATISLKSLGASKALIREVRDLKNLSLDMLLPDSIKYLNESSKITFVQKFKTDIAIMMEYLTVNLNPNDHHILWTKYFNLAVKLKATLKKSDQNDYELFDKIQAELINKFVHRDWRVVSKLKQVEKIFNIQNDLNDSEIILERFKERIISSLEYIIWNENASSLLKYTNNILTKLFAYIQTSEKKEDVINKIVNGRFDKGIFSEKTLILGEDGGLYALLNSIEGEELEAVKKITGEDYIKDKIIKNNKIVIGKGAFGIVRFALSLFITQKALPGQLVCIKKTQTISFLERSLPESEPEAESEENKLTREAKAIHYVIDSTLGDYFSSNEDITGSIYSPRVLDVFLGIYDNTSPNHRKGYLMMEIVPQNTGTSVLIQKKAQVDWVSDIKPYIKQVFEQILALLNKNIAMTDLKPDNTLYDIENKRAYIIDLGGSLKIEEGVEKCKLKNHDFQFTPRYMAPEISPDANIINLRIALAFSCGKILNEVITTNNCEQDLVRISEQMMISDPGERMSIEAGLEGILKIGDNKIKNKNLFELYINKIKDRLEKNRSSISINEDIYEIKELLIPAQVIKSDPDIIKDERPLNLQEKFEEFIETKVLDSNLFLILGNAGSGKSIFLQLEFIKAVNSWDHSKPLPIYFNLANETALTSVINSLDSELKINLYDFIFDKNENKNLIFFIDSFDEGIFKNDLERDNLIREYSNHLKAKHLKIILTCRSDYLKNYEDYEKWFIIDNNQTSPSMKPIKYYIIPFTYEGEKLLDTTNQDNFNLKNLVRTYIENINKMSNTEKDWSIFYELIVKAGLESEITTGFIFQMVMKTYLYLDTQSLNRDNDRTTIKTKVDIYRQFISFYIKNNIKDKFVVTEDQKFCMLKEKNDHDFETKMQNVLFELGIYVAENLFIKGEYRLKKNDKLFDLLDYPKTENVIDFHHTRAYYVLRNLPLKIEIKKEKNGKQEIAIGFIHDALKNYFLLEGIKKEASDESCQTLCSKILGAKNFANDRELIKFLRDGILEDPEAYKLITNFLNKQLYYTRKRINEEYINSSSNSMTILVSAQYSFCGRDLTKTVIRRANMRNGDFEHTNFKDADLQESRMTNSKLGTALLLDCNLSNINLGVNPDIRYKDESFSKIIFSPCGKYLATSSGDSFHDPKLWSFSSSKLVKIYHGSQGGQKDLAFSPDGKYLAAGSLDAYARIWEVATGKELHILKGHPNYVLKVIFSPDGKFLATRGWDNTPKIWDVSTGCQLHGLEHADNVSDICFSPDGNLIATSSHLKIIFWEVSSGSLVKIIKQNSSIISFSPDGRYLAASLDSILNLFEVGSLELWKSLQGHTDTIENFKFSPDGKYISTCSKDWTAKVWEVSSGKLLHDLKGHTNNEMEICYSSDGKYLATCSNDKKIKIWDAMTGKLIQNLEEHTGKVVSICFSPDGKYLASCSWDCTAKIWQISYDSTLQNLQGHTNKINYACFSPDEKYLATCSDDKTIKIWDVYLGIRLQNLTFHTDRVTKVCFSPDGKLIATCSWDFTAKICEFSSGKLLHTLKGHTSVVLDLFFSSDGMHLATYSHDGTAKIWEVLSGKLSQIFSGHKSQVYNICFSPDGKSLATCFMDQTAKICDVATGNEVQHLQGHTESIQSMCYSPDEKFLAAVSKNYSIIIWDVSSGKELHLLEGHAICFSPDGMGLATCSSDLTAKIWEVGSGILKQTFKGHTDAIRKIIYSKDGKNLVTGSEDHTVKIWDVLTGKELQNLQGHTDIISNIEFSPGDKYLATCSWDFTAKIWNCSHKTDDVYSDPPKPQDTTRTTIHFDGSDKNTTTTRISGTKKISFGYDADSKYYSSSIPIKMKMLDAELHKTLIGNENSLKFYGARIYNCKFSSKNKIIFEQRGAVIVNPLEEDGPLPEQSKIISNLIDRSFEHFKGLDVISNRSLPEIIVEILAASSKLQEKIEIDKHKSSEHKESHSLSTINEEFFVINLSFNENDISRKQFDQNNVKINEPNLETPTNKITNHAEIVIQESKPQVQASQVPKKGCLGFKRCFKIKNPFGQK